MFSVVFLNTAPSKTFSQQEQWIITLPSGPEGDGVCVCSGGGGGLDLCRYIKKISELTRQLN